jgi:hypothetical protein
MSAFGFAPQALRASAKFQKDPAVEKELNDDRKRKLQAQEPLLAHALINNILQPARETIGNHYNQNCRELLEITWSTSLVTMSSSLRKILTFRGLL